MAVVTTVLCQRVRLSVVFGYLLAGMIVGPHVPIPLVANIVTVNALAELGVVLLMFCIGLEFSLRRMLHLAPISGLIALLETSAVFGLGVGAASGSVAERIDRRLPAALQTFVALYGSWFETLRRSCAPQQARSRERLLLGLLALDVVVLVTMVIAAAVEMPRGIALLGAWIGAGESVARLLVLAGTSDAVAAAIRLRQLQHRHGATRHLRQPAVPRPGHFVLHEVGCDVRFSHVRGAAPCVAHACRQATRHHLRHTSLRMAGGARVA